MAVIPPEPLLSTRHVAAAFGVQPQTITRWARIGKLTPIKTLGGHRRYWKAEVYALLSSETRPTDPGETPNPHPNNKKKRKDNTAPDHDVITRARLTALATALTAYGLRVRVGADALAVRNPTPHGRDTSPNPGRYQAITPTPDPTGTPTWHWAWTTPGCDTRLHTRPIAPAHDIDTTAATIARALGTPPRRRRAGRPPGRPRTTPTTKGQT